jgi:hypothetical protein
MSCVICNALVPLFPMPLQVKHFKVYGHLAADIFVIFALVSLAVGVQEVAFESFAARIFEHLDDSSGSRETTSDGIYRNDGRRKEGQNYEQ